VASTRYFIDAASGVLVEVTAEYATDLFSREFPPDVASRPIVSYDVREVVVDIGDEIQAVARDILNSQTSQGSAA
jgi:hypothetical protein